MTDLDKLEAFCNNCDSPTKGAYCHVCGQRTQINKVTFKETFGDLADGLFSLQAPIWKTVKHLVTRPGALLRDYLSGKRKRYYKPVSFFILTSALYLLVRWAIGFDIESDSTIIVGEGEAQLLTQARTFMLLHIDKLVFFFVITMASLLKLFFYKRYSLAEYFAVAFYMVGFYMLIATLNIVFITYMDSTNQSLAMFTMLLYFVLAMTLFFRRPKFWIVIKSAVVFLVGAGLYITMAYGLSYLIVAITRS